MIRTPAVLALVCAVAAPLLAAAAPPGSENYYAPAKLLKRGSSATPVAGPGKVIVQVFVNKDGTFKIQRIVSSTNPGDNQTALEIAKSSTYKPASKGGKAVPSFYTFVLDIKANGQASGPEDTSALGQAERMLKGGNFSGARSSLTDYLAAHPDDSRAHVDLAVADFYLNDYAAAAGQFDKVSSVPQNYQSIAARSYNEAAVSAINKQDFTAGAALAKRAAQLAPGFGAYDTLGIAEFKSNDTAAAINDLEKARTYAASDKIPVKNQVLNDSFLVAAYLAQNQPDKAKHMLAAVKALDPTSTQAEDAYANYYAKRANDLAVSAKYADAAGAYEAAAADVPSHAADFWGQAALGWLRVEKPDTAKARADAEKSIAADASNVYGNFAMGIILANDGKKPEALAALQKADDAAKKGSNASLTAAIETQIKRLNGTK